MSDFETLQESIVEDAQDLVNALKGDLNEFTTRQLAEIRDRAFVVYSAAKREIERR